MKMQKSPSDPCVHPSGCRCVRPVAAPSLGRGNGAGKIGACCHTNCRSCCCGSGSGFAACPEAGGLHGSRSGHRASTVSAGCGCATASTETTTRMPTGYGAAPACGIGSDSRCDSGFAHGCGSERASDDDVSVRAIHDPTTRSGCGHVVTAAA